MTDKILITGMPRSGTSYVGQLFDSHPRTIFRMEPLFAYRFKNMLNNGSTCTEVKALWNSLVDVEDDFMDQRDKRLAGSYPTFSKKKPSTLVVKTTRHHELLEKYLTCLPEITVFAVIRHPCGAINSWLKSPKEFREKGCKTERDWRTGGCRKSGVGEYWGFNDWIEITKKFIRLESQYKNFHILRYEDLVNETDQRLKAAFSLADLDYPTQTQEFIKKSHQEHVNDPYSVFKSPDVAYQWKNELQRDISDEIIADAIEEGLQDFVI